MRSHLSPVQDQLRSEFIDRDEWVRVTRRLLSSRIEMIKVGQLALRLDAQNFAQGSDAKFFTAVGLPSLHDRDKACVLFLDPLIHFGHEDDAPVLRDALFRLAFGHVVDESALLVLKDGLRRTLTPLRGASHHTDLKRSHQLFNFDVVFVDGADVGLGFTMKHHYVLLVFLEVELLAARRICVVVEADARVVKHVAVSEGNLVEVMGDTALLKVLLVSKVH
mmetsp:Transcript_5298/g.6502  ORF Transcript_5298/g.6502 Transcript_5298/m.6502 type:complete len:221 (-) Transcript_5298:509-1171(-)